MVAGGKGQGPEMGHSRGVALMGLPPRKSEGVVILSNRISGRRSKQFREAGQDEI